MANVKLQKSLTSNYRLLLLTTLHVLLNKTSLDDDKNENVFNINNLF
jgi:hypothetical protein